MPASISSVTIDDGGEQVIVILAGVAASLAGGSAVFHFNRTPTAAQLVQAAYVINSDTRITINGLNKVSGGAADYIRAGERVTFDYVSGLTGNSIAIGAISAVVCVNNSERRPKILTTNKFYCNQDTPTENYLNGISEGQVKIFKTSDITAGIPVLIAQTQIRGGRWQESILLDVGTAYTFQYFNNERVLKATKTLTV